MERRIVYDSDTVQPGRCPTCGKRLDRCSCEQQRRVSASPTSAVQNLPRDGVLRIVRDRKGRGGKTVTVIAGSSGAPTAPAELNTERRRVCGAGRTGRPPARRGE